MYTKIIFSLALTLFLFSCENNIKNEPLELNNGEKWQINAEMMPPLKTSKKLLSEYTDGAQKDYKALADKLKENNKVLISSCTMNGKSHDELHKWLHPYMGLVDELANANDDTEASLVLGKIEKSFETFDQYFQ